MAARQAGITPLEPGDIARTIFYVLAQPPNVDISEVMIRPTAPTP